MNKLFVYGTLRREGVGIPAFIHGDLYDIGPFPAVKNAGTSENWVRGEIHEVDDDRLEQLDQYESVPNLYTRKEVEVFGLDRKPFGFKVWVYQFAQKIYGTVCGEEWKRRRAR